MFDSWVIIKCIGVRHCAGCKRQKELKVDTLLANLNFRNEKGKTLQEWFWCSCFYCLW